MIFRTVLLILLLTACGGMLSARGAEPRPKRVYQAVRIEGADPTIDGRLDEVCWQQGEWSGEYIQREPFEGKPGSHPTEIKILYNNRAVFVAIRSTDPEILRQPRVLGQRDDFSGDMAGVAFDSYLNKKTAFEFDVSSGGAKIDLILRNDGSIDKNWNAVWDVKVAADEHGWTAEYRIPLSQLRYSRAKEQVWGLHSWRWINRKQEESNWQLIPMDHHGMVREFGELRGIRDLPPSRRIELMPYAVVKHESLQKQPGNPYRSKDETSVDGGLDAKIGLASDFTLDLTVNPDFGQVEADPSEINLSTTETFFSERRPFFIEGKAMFDYGLDSDVPFYSRRIGDAPSLTPASSGFVKMPANNPIVTAEKVTGRTEGGFSLGVLHALTNETQARIYEPGTNERREIAEPQTNYLVIRGQNDFSDGNTTLGGIFTATLRHGDERELSVLAKEAVTAGLEAVHYWGGRMYYVEARALGTRIRGSASAITGLMRNLVHNYGRPDADHVELDPGARELTGDAGRVHAGKAMGLWRYYGGVSWRSPGVDFNDLGYLATADFVEYSAELQYYNAEPGTWLRRRKLELRPSSTFSSGGERLENELTFEGEIAGLSNWFVAMDLEWESSRLDTRVLRGGPALRRPDRFPLWFYAETDGGKPRQWRFSAGGSVVPEDDSRYWEIEPAIVQRIGDRWRFDVKVGYAENLSMSQYAGQAATTAGQRYLLGRMNQKTLWSELRMQVNVSPTLSVTYFAGPYASTGRFDRFKRVTQPRASRDEDRFTAQATERNGNSYRASADGEVFEFADPNFNWRELKSNLVLRWEFRPGSSLYAVWSQHRADGRDTGEFGGADEYRRLLSAHPDNTFLVKMSYWFSI